MLKTSFNLELGDFPEYFPRTYGEMFAVPMMADRALQQQATGAANTAAGTASGYGNAAGGIGATMTPILTREASGGGGLTATQQNNELVAGAQGAGGANAGVVGQAGLAANRTHNTGSLSTVLDAAARDKTKQLSNNTLGVANQNTGVQLGQQSDALKQLGGMYGQDVSAQLGAQRNQNADIGTAIQAGNSGWLQNGLAIGNTVADLGKAAGSTMTGMYGNQGMMNS
jgi:hypothetical protein